MWRRLPGRRLETTVPTIVTYVFSLSREMFIANASCYLIYERIASHYLTAIRQAKELIRHRREREHFPLRASVDLFANIYEKKTK